MQGAGDLAAALDSLVLTDRGQDGRQAVLPSSGPFKSPRHRDVPRAPWHGLINLW